MKLKMEEVELLEWEGMSTDITAGKTYFLVSCGCGEVMFLDDIGDRRFATNGIWSGYE